MILAGDVGGTNTRLALFESGSATPAVVETFSSRDHAGLAELIERFLVDNPCQIDRVCVGVAGPVLAERVEAVNLPWEVDARAIAATTGGAAVKLINDLEANAWGIAALGDDDLETLNEGTPDPSGDAVVVSAGTGLGVALLVWDGERHRVVASEGGHATFAPQNELEIELHRFLAAEHGHVSYERVCSGLGLANIYRFLLWVESQPEPDWHREARDAAEAIGRAAAEGDDLAARALETMISVYGSHAGNLALTVLATGGVFLGGGIPPRILPELRAGGFVRSFVDKGRLRKFLETVPVRVILNDRTALYGAALCAQAPLE